MVPPGMGSPGEPSVRCWAHADPGDVGMGNRREHDVLKHTRVCACHQRFGPSRPIGGILNIIFYLLADDLN